MAEPRTVRENANALTSEQIAAILPHRYPFALVDRILDYEPGQWAIGRKCVSRNEEFFCGHFPGQPVMPGVLILEALAQTGAVAALSLPENRGKLALFGGIKNARFRKQVTPGDVLTLHCELVEQRGPVGVGKASAYVDGKCAATEAAGALFLRVLDELPGRALLHHHAAVHEQDAVGHVTGKVHLVGHDDHGGLAVGQVPQNAQHLAGQLRVQRAGRLVEAEDIRVQG